MNILLLKLFVAHLIGDFFLQPDSWVAEKEAKKLKSPRLYYHALIHGVLLFLFFWNLSYWPQAILLMVLHFFTDALKLVFQNRQNGRLWFFADQFLHLTAIIAVVYSIQHFSVDLGFFQSGSFWVRFLAVLFLVFPSSVTIKVLIAQWTPTSLPTATNINSNTASLQSAGKYIGIIERLLVFLFASINHWEAVGFLIAAKSVFRFGDLKDGSDLKLTEYILIGTLLSFGMAVVTALVSLALL